MDIRNGVEIFNSTVMASPDINDPDIDDGTIDGTTLTTVTLVSGDVSPTTLMLAEATPVNAVAATGTVTFSGLPNVYVANVNSTGTITVSGTPVAEEVFVVGTQTFTFKETRSAAGEVTIDADNTQQAVNIVAAITSDIPAEATATNLAGVVTVTAVADGTAGDLVTLTETATGVAVSAGGTLASGVDEVLETTTVGSQVFTYVTLRASAGEVTVGGDATETATNFKTALNLDMTTVDAESSLGVVTLTAATKGVAGNSIALAEDATNTAVGAAALAGGVDGTVGAANETVADTSGIYHSTGANTISGANWEKIEFGAKETLLSTTTVTFAVDGATTLYTVPTGKRCILDRAVIIAAADAGTTTVTIGKVGALTDFLGTQTLSNLDAQYDAVILQPVPNATPVIVKSYAATTVIQIDVGAHAGSAGNTVMLYGALY